MNTSANLTHIDSAVPSEVQRIHDLLSAQKAAYRANPMPSAAERIERLSRLRRVLVTHQDAIAQAISDDFGNRSIDETKISELMTCLEYIDYASKRVARWMQPSKRHIGLIHQPAKGWVSYQPLGVVGIMSPWNYPLFLTISPLICALAAGNHAMLKMSSSSARLGALLEKIFAEVFPLELLAVVNGGGIISDTFCRLPVDLLVFTGSSAIGKTVMAAAAENLTPVVLELGGKSPVLVHDSVPMKDVAERVAFGKAWNAGQTCVAPDYILLPRGKTHEFVTEMRTLISKHYPTLLENPDYTSIINDKQYHRLQGYLSDARKQGATFFEINPANEDLSGTRKIAPTLLTNVTAEMDVCQNEIFGPILPIIEYDTIEEALNYINDRPHPLALYYFDYDAKRAQYIADHTHSGQFGINAVLTHPVHSDLPFGGVGNAGMGKYHAQEGFLTMSHTRAVLQNPKFYSLKMIMPPFGKRAHQILGKVFFH
ncbi:coniferyl aldehyde dehydrogenase [Aquirhabdus parva]|uniref:Aldehyde dehydrogenase n=1 Tax=Aquirhabdus parva TaxID=2283318 RepID=A0A345P8M0_9GAMM|nr:coniferyl aldehyde dehydrogenase [Aquirhabdus parva]AXI03629.1 coniferyl aldehyde dehydrogenase [Aquirhabdus parva]